MKRNKDRFCKKRLTFKHSKNEAESIDATHGIELDEIKKELTDILLTDTQKTRRIVDQTANSTQKKIGDKGNEILRFIDKTATQTKKLLNVINENNSHLSTKLGQSHTPSASIEQVDTQIKAEYQLQFNELIERHNRTTKQLHIRNLREQKFKEIFQGRLKKIIDSPEWTRKRVVSRFFSKLTGGAIKPYSTWQQYMDKVDGTVCKHIKDCEGNPLLTTQDFFDKDQILSALDNKRSLNPNDSDTTKRDEIHLGIASVSWRLDALEQVLDSVYDQVDHIYVYCNDYEHEPAFLQRPKIKIFSDQGDIGDIGKFRMVDEVEGYFITIDDDIIYPEYYIQSLINGIEKYQRKAVVGWHGSVFLEPFEDYYTKESRRVYSFASKRPEDTPVHVLGTGCIGFHTSTLEISRSLFNLPNMADVYFAEAALKQKTPMVLLKHERKEAIPLVIPNDRQINQESSKGIENSKLNTKDEQNRIVKAHTWELFQAPKPYMSPMKIGYLGRTNEARWKKGGILRSAKLIKNLLLADGHDFFETDVEDSYEEQVSILENADLIIIYLGDLNRPDFKYAQAIIDKFKKDKKILINLSYNKVDSRTAEIVEFIKKENLHLMLFTESAKQNTIFSDIRDRIVVLPKTLKLSSVPKANYYKTEGIFIGDYQKNINEELVGSKIEEWIEPLKKALPDVPIYLIRQYGGKLNREIPGVEVVPYMKEQLHSWMSQRRLTLCLTPYTTYEMVPAESAGLGVPVIHRHMDQSLSEDLGSAAKVVNNPNELAHAAKLLYNDPSLWKRFSDSGIQRIESQTTEHASSLFILELHRVLHTD